MRSGQRLSGPRRTVPPGLAVCAVVLMATISALCGCRTGPRAPRGPAVVPPPAVEAAVFPGGDGIIKRAELSGYAGSAACAGCHPAETRAQSRTHHAHALRRVTDFDRRLFGEGGAARDRERAVDYRTSLRSGDCILSASRADRREEIRALYAFGSGEGGCTYLGQRGHRPVELRLSYYRERRGWDFSPDQAPGTAVELPTGHLLGTVEERRCFACHSAAVVATAEGVDGAHSLLGVQCESCHGPAAAHVAAAKRGQRDLQITSLGRWPDRLSTELCGRCHRPLGSSDLDDPNVSAQLPRFQSVAFPLSPCVQRSGARFTCISCHDPHGDAVRGNDAAYNRVCASCHAENHAEAQICPRSAQGDCISCHMPTRTLAMPGRPRYRMHWISVWTR